MLQVYTGTGKGKTTAAIGLTIRAYGAGKNIYIMQFMKSLFYSEQDVLKNMSPHIFLETSGKPFFIAEEGMLSDAEKKAWGDEVVIFPKGKPPKDYVSMIKKGFRKAVTEALSGKYFLVIFDEINVALFFELVSRKEMEEFLLKLPPTIELVCTGRNAPKWLIERADLVTEMKEIKHYYQNGTVARKGIEN